MVRRALAMLLMLLVALPALAARAELQMNSRDLSVGQLSDLKIVVVGEPPTSIPRVQAPEGISLRFKDQGYRVVRSGGRVVQLWELTYQLEPAQTGDFTLGPFEVPVASGTATTKTLSIHVQPAPELDAVPLAVEAHFLTPEAWEGQVVLYRYRISHRVKVEASQWTLPPFDGLIAPRDGTRPRSQYALEDEHGIVAIDETTLPFVVTGTGDLTQPPATARLHLPVDDPAFRHFGHLPGFTPTETQLMVTEPAPLQARPLPPAPQGYSGLVGDFHFQASLGTRRAAVGESIDWKVEVEGDGSLEGFELPRLDVGELARIYEGSPAVSAQVTSGRYEARGTLSQVIVPTTEGRLELPPVQIIAFSPSQGRYVTHTLTIPPIQVTQGEATSAEVQSFGQVPAIPEPGQEAGFQQRDIRPPVASAPAWVLPWDRALPLLLLLAGAPGAGALGLLGYRRLSERRAARERGEVVISPSQRLKHLPTEPQARLTAMDGALREALARHTGTEVAQLDRDTALGALPEALSARVADMLAALDRARFGGADPSTVNEASLAALVQELERP